MVTVEILPYSHEIAISVDGDTRAVLLREEALSLLSQLAVMLLPEPQDAA